MGVDAVQQCGTAATRGVTLALDPGSYQVRYDFGAWSPWGDEAGVLDPWLNVVNITDILSGQTERLGDFSPTQSALEVQTAAEARFPTYEAAGAMALARQDVEFLRITVPQRRTFAFWVFDGDCSDNWGAVWLRVTRLGPADGMSFNMSRSLQAPAPGSGGGWS